MVMLLNSYLIIKLMITRFLNFLQAFIIVFKGMLIGIANLIPGVSGGTVAVLLDIYDRLIFSFNALISRSSDAKKSLLFLIQIMVGVLISILVFSNVLLSLISTREIELSFLFIGLIIGSIPTVLRYETNTSGPKILHGLKWRLPNRMEFIWFSLAFGLMIGLTLISHSGLSHTGPEWINSWWYLILCGIVAAASMVIPGLSGSLMLIIMGAYSLILNAVSQFDGSFLAPFIVGILIGFIVMVRLVSWCLHHHLRKSLWAITGFLCGSILTLWHPLPHSFLGIKYLLFIGVGIILVEKLQRAKRL